MAERRFWQPARFLPSGGGTSAPLLWVISVMMFLLSMVLSAAFAVFNATDQWTEDLSSEFSVQISVVDPESRDRQTAAAVEILRSTPGISDAQALDTGDMAELLEPWIGTGNMTDDLPVPALITARIEDGVAVDLSALATRIAEVAPNARVDDHQSWLGELARLATIIETVAIVSMVLMLVATGAIVIFGSRARLLAHWDIIEIVHLMGANDRTIGNEFRDRFMRYGLTGGTFGLAGALLIVGPAHFMSGTTGFEIFPNLKLTVWQLSILALVPIMSAGLSMVTADMAVRRTLSKML